MRPSHRFVLGAIVVFTLGVSAAAGERSEGPAQPFAPAMHHSMERMMQDMAVAMTGDPDKDFLLMMIPHHQGAVDMARLVLIHGRDPLVRRLAEEIIAGQQTEIDAMRARLSILQRGADAAPDNFPALHGTRGVAPAGR